ncbi:MAG: prenyltransferase [Bacteroidales bacterium]|nr:MAG: prenyltransferase [Bacteroidales bacterium]
MDKPGILKIWLAQVRAPFLILAVLLVMIGLALSYKLPGEEIDFNILHAVLLVIGVVSAHTAVNLFNEYSDFKTRIDFHTIRNPFSGGSGMMIEGHTSPKSVKGAAISALILAFGIGVYFTFVSHWIIFILVLIGGLTIVFYTEGLARIMLGELFAGLTLGSLVVVGTYIAMTSNPQKELGELLSTVVVMVSIPPGILTSLLLLINEFPDVEADKAGGRLHLVIKLGKRKAAIIYNIGIALTFAILLIIPIIQLAAFWIYIALIPFPLGLKACTTLMRHREDNQKIIPALGTNVITVLATDLLIAVSVLISI